MGTATIHKVYKFALTLQMASSIRTFGRSELSLMTCSTPISFGDNVRILCTPETEGLGLVGLTGEVRGETTPSVMGIEVIGEVKDDFAFNVFIEDRDEDYWFAPYLLEFVDHAVETVMWVEGDSKKWVRTVDGDWEESQVKERGFVQRLFGIFKWNR